MEALELKAELREDKGKSYARKIRREGFLPCVLYGSDTETLPLAVKTKDLDKVIKRGGDNVLIKVKVDGKEYNTLLREVQRHPVKDELLHADLYSISLREKLTTTVELQVVGDAPGAEEGGVLQQALREVEIECLPANIPDYIEVDVSNLHFGESMNAGDLDPSEGVEILTDPEETVVSVVAVREEVEEPVEVEEEELEEGEVPEDAEEGEDREEPAEE